MPKAAEQFRQSDITFWGIAALVCGAVAVLSANVSAVMPDSFLAGLHTSRLSGADMSSLRAEVAMLEGDAAKLRDANRELTRRISLVDTTVSDATRRVGALEISIPNLLEAVSPGSELDRSVLTSAIPERDPGQSFNADGGSVTIHQVPLAGQPATPASQALPPILSASATYGIAVGPAVTAGNASATWHDLSDKLGALFLDYDPLLSTNDGATNGHLVVGPLENLTAATRLCQRLEAVAVACLPVPYTGTPVITP